MAGLAARLRQQAGQASDAGQNVRTASQASKGGGAHLKRLSPETGFSSLGRLSPFCGQCSRGRSQGEEADVRNTPACARAASERRRCKVGSSSRGRRGAGCCCSTHTIWPSTGTRMITGGPLVVELPCRHRCAGQEKVGRRGNRGRRCGTPGGQGTAGGGTSRTGAGCLEF